MIARHSNPVMTTLTRISALAAVTLLTAASRMS